MCVDCTADERLLSVYMSKMGYTKLKVVDVPRDTMLVTSIKRDWHGGRSGRAYILYDNVTNSLILSSKLKSMAAHINDKYTRHDHETVSARGLYEAAISQRHYPHKMRYHVSRCDLNTAHLEFQNARELRDVEHASLVTEVMVE